MSPVPPVVKDFDVFRELAKAGQRLAEIHVNNEPQPEYPLIKTEKPGKQLDWRVTKMRLSKDKTTHIQKTTPNTSSALSAKSSPSASKPGRS